MSEYELDALGQRIEVLALSHEDISAPWHSFLRPILYRIGWQPDIKLGKLKAFLAAIRDFHRDASTREDCEELFEKAQDELAHNVRQIERATVINQRVLVSYVAWLRRCYELLVIAIRELSGELHSLIGQRDQGLLLPPMTMAKARPVPEAAPEEPQEQQGPTPDVNRVMELQLDTIDHLMSAARQDDALLGRRRRLLHAARQLLLESYAALRLDEEAVQSRLQNISQQITMMNRYQALGLQPNVHLLHQARQALARGDHNKLFAAVSLLNQSAIDQLDLSLAAHTSKVLSRMQQAQHSEHEGESLLRSAQEVFGSRVVDAIKGGYQQARDVERKPDPDDPFLAAVVKQYYAPGAERDALAHALAVDGCFEVGGTLSPIRIEEEFRVPVIVPFPTESLRLVPATSANELATSVIHDPRMVIMDLAAGRLLARRFTRQEPRLAPRP